MTKKIKKINLEDKANELMKNFVQEAMEIGIELLGKEPRAIEVFQYAMEFSYSILYNLTGAMTLPLMYKAKLEKDEIKGEFGKMIDWICECVKKEANEAIEECYRNNVHH